MKACVARASQQIEEKQYETELVADGGLQGSGSENMDLHLMEKRF